jgi:hypothetical protein
MLEFFEASVSSPSGASEGVFIPIGDLPGVEASEFANADPQEVKEAKAVLGLLNAINNNLPNAALGLTITRNTGSGGLDLTNNAFSITSQLYADHETKTLDTLPIPNTGSNSGVGDVSIDTLFPNAEKIATDDAISGEGFLVPTADVERHGAPDHASIVLSDDSRLWVQGLAEWLSVNLEVRTASQESAITARTRSNTQAVTLPTAATDSTNPTTGLSASDLNKISVFSHNYAVTIQTKMDQSTQKFDVNVVTA